MRRASAKPQPNKKPPKHDAKTKHIPGDLAETVWGHFPYCSCALEGDPSTSITPSQAAEQTPQTLTSPQNPTQPKNEIPHHQTITNKTQPIKTLQRHNPTKPHTTPRKLFSETWFCGILRELHDRKATTRQNTTKRPGNRANPPKTDQAKTNTTQQNPTQQNPAKTKPEETLHNPTGQNPSRPNPSKTLQRWNPAKPHTTLLRLFS